MLKPKPVPARPVAVKGSPKDAGARESTAAVARRNTLLREAVFEEARRGGLLDGEKSEHVSVRVPPALLAAAKRESGMNSTSELAMLALAMIALPDPVAAIMKKTRGRLGKDHKLDI